MAYIRKDEFLAIVLEFNIWPEVALGLDGVADAIKSGNAAELRRVLTEEF